MTQANAPNLRFETIGEARGGGPWELAFAVANDGPDPVALVEARMPHVVLRAEAQDLAARPALAAGERARLDFSATYQPRDNDEEASNPFIILLVRWRGEDWRVLAQLALSRGDAGEPVVGIARVSSQRVGFSGTAT